MTDTYTYPQLSKLAKKDSAGLPCCRLALLGDCSLEHFETALRGCAVAGGLHLEIYNAGYDRIDAQALDAGSGLYAFLPGYVLIFMCTEKLYDSWLLTPAGGREAFAQNTFERIRNYWRHISSNCGARILQLNFAEKNDCVFGNFAARQPSSFIFQLRKLNMLLMENCPPDVFPVDLLSAQSRIGNDKFFDPRLHYIAKMPVSLDALPVLASNVIDVIQALRGNIKKCAVLDLDNTLWGGVIGDDGPGGIEIGELGSGRIYSAIQAWFKELKERGILLAVCSKNDEATAKEAFEKNSEMVLGLDDFSVFIANRGDKAANIQQIQQTLNIGMDSIVFVDDNPFERELVRSLIPGITVPELPGSPEQYLPYLQSLNLFETASYSEEDAGRTQQYRAEAQRSSLLQECASYDDYLQSLEMKASSAPFDELNAPRIAQLTQRSNQFNLRTVRYTEAGIMAAANDPAKITLYFKLKDKLSDYGLVSVVIMEKRGGGGTPDSGGNPGGGSTPGGSSTPGTCEAPGLFIETWLMSCRVLGRGMEEFIINTIIGTAKQHGFRTVTGEYIETAKNAMVADIYEKMGFERIGGNIFKAQADEFPLRPTYITPL